MTESIPLRLRAGGSVVLPEGSTESDIDQAGRELAERKQREEQEQIDKAKTQEEQS